MTTYLVMQCFYKDCFKGLTMQFKSGFGNELTKMQ